MPTSATPGIALKVFCSHTSADKPVVLEFARRLREEKGIDAWVDEWEVLAGDDLVARINVGLEQCSAGLVFFSKNTAGSEWVSAEISALIISMIKRGQRIVPVMIDADAPVPALLTSRVRRDIDHFDQIAEALLGRSSKPALGATPSATSVHRFVLHLARSPSKAQELTITATYDGNEVAQAIAPLPPNILDSYANWVSGTVRPSRSPAIARHNAFARALETLGLALGKTIYPGNVGMALDGKLAELKVGEQFELVFESADDALLAMPLEAASTPAARVPALLPSVATLRRRDKSKVSNTPQASPLKILVAVGAPDEDKTQAGVLDLEAELQLILNAVEQATVHGNAEVRFLEVGHPDEIRRALQHDAYHVLHLSGHGQPGLVLLENEHGQEVPTSAAELAAALHESGRSLPMVFLSFCHGGVAASDTTGFAQALVNEGVPMVVAMQSRVTDAYAAQLSGAVYDALANEEHTVVSRALAHARRHLENRRRKALDAGVSPDLLQPEYATPTLFVAGGEAPLVDYSLDRIPLRKPPVHAVLGPVIELGIGDLIGRRKELRAVLTAIRDGRDDKAGTGGLSGAMLTGMGGVGKSALAGRAMAVLKEGGWRVAAISGPFDLNAVSVAFATELRRLGDSASQSLATDLKTASDEARLDIIRRLLHDEPWLLVLDNFEDNLVTGGGAYLDATVRLIIEGILGACRRGSLLVTCRYPVPGLAGSLSHMPLGPLSLASTRKLFHRLPALKEEAPDVLADLFQTIGGHPRMLEYIDGLLNRGRARLQHVARRLSECARAVGVPVDAVRTDLSEAVRDSLTIAAHDICLDALLEIAASDGDLDTLHQISVSGLPVSIEGIAHALLGKPAEPLEIEREAARVQRLVDSSLVTLRSDGEVWVHRWTAQALRERADDAAYHDCCRRMGSYHIESLPKSSNAFATASEAVRNFLQATDWDSAVGVAWSVVQSLLKTNQRAVAAVLAGETLRDLPLDHPGFAPLADVEASTHIALGYTQRAKERYQSLLTAFQQRAAAEPHRADYQRDLSVSFERMGDLLRALGQGEDARRYYQDSLDIGQRLAEAEPDRADYQRDLSVSFNKMGDLLRALGQGEDARRYYQDSLDIGQRLAEAEPDRADYQRDLSVSFERMGDLLRALGQGEDARRYYEQDLDIAQRLAEAEPDRADYQRDLSVSFERMGDLLRALGQGEDARRYYEQDLDIAQRLAEAEPDRADYQRDLSVSFNKMGDLLRALGQGEDARRYYQDCLSIRQRLAEAEPDRADYQRDLSVSFNKMGDLLRALGQGEDARRYYQDSLDIGQRLAEAEPDRADYQRDLSVSFNKMGDLLRALGQGEDARRYYQDCLDIGQRLAEAEPDRADYQRDLSVSFNKMGDLLRALGQGEDARRYYQDCLSIRQRLAEAEPDRADYQRDLSVSFERMGDLLRALGQGEDARRYYQDCLSIRQRLAEAEPDRADYQRDLSVSFNKMGDLLRALGQGEDARRYYEQDLDIAQRLAEAEPDRADYQRDLSVSFNKMGDLLRALGQGEDARRYYQDSLDIGQRLAEAEPDRADYQRDLSVSFNKMGDLLRALGQGEDARRYYQDCLSIRQRLAEAEPDRADYQRDLATLLERTGDMLIAIEDPVNAVKYFRQALDIRSKLVEQDPENAEVRVAVVVPLVRLSRLDQSCAAEYVDRAIGILSELEAQGRLLPAYRQWLDQLRTD